MDDNRRNKVIFYIGTKKDGSLYPGRTTLYALDMLPVGKNMTEEQRKQVYRENCKRAAERLNSFESYKNHRIHDVTGNNGIIRDKSGQDFKVKDMVKSVLDSKGKDSLFNKPVGIFFNFTCMTALHQSLTATPANREKLLNYNAFFDNDAVYVGKISPAEAMNLYVYLDRTNQLEQALGGFSKFREIALRDYYRPQIEKDYKQEKARASKKFFDANGQPKAPNSRELYGKALTEAEKKRADAYAELGETAPVINNNQQKGQWQSNYQNTQYQKPQQYQNNYQNQAPGQSQPVQNFGQPTQPVQKNGYTKQTYKSQPKQSYGQPVQNTQNSGYVKQTYQTQPKQNYGQPVQNSGYVKKTNYVKPVQAQPVQMTAKPKPVVKNLFSQEDYKLKIADEMIKEDERDTDANLAKLEPVNKNAAANEGKNTFDVYTPEELKRLASLIRMVNSEYTDEETKLRDMKMRFIQHRELRELLYRAGDTKTAVEKLKEAGAGNDAEVFLALRDKGKVSIPSAYQLEAMSNFKEGETRAIIAVPGSGKTTSLIFTIESLLARNHAKPEEITMISFTTNAASEFRKRMDRRNPDLIGKGMHISTAHSLARSIIKKYSAGKMPNLLTEEEQKNLMENDVVKEMTVKLNLDARESDRLKKDIKRALDNIMLAPWSDKQLKETAEQYGIHPDYLRMAQGIYTEKKKAIQKLDFNDLLLKAMEILEKDPVARKEVQSHCKALIVDEYQDTSPLQRAFEKLLKPEDGIKIVVGDDHQAIFSSLGSRSEYLQNDAVDNKDSYYVLPTNYRSDSALIKAYNDVKDSIERTSTKDMSPSKGREEGDKAEIYEFSAENAEINFIIDDIKKRIAAGEKPQDIVVLCRWNDDVKEIKKQLSADDVLRDCLEKTKDNPIIENFIKNPEKKACDTILESLSTPDNPNLFNALLDQQDTNFDKCYVDENSKTPLEDFKKKAFATDIPKTTINGLVKAYESALKEQTASDAIKTYLAESHGYDSTEDFMEAAPKDLKNYLDVLEMNKVARGDGLDFISRMDEEAVETKKVVERPGIAVKSIHKAKGEEAGTVYMYKQTEYNLSRFTEKISDPEVKAKNRIEEEKIAYTGMTRARKKLIITGRKSNIANIYNRIKPENVIHYVDGKKVDTGKKAERAPDSPVLKYKDVKPKVRQKVKSHAKDLIDADFH